MMKGYISEAIRERRLLRLIYDQRKRLTVEPYVMGCSVTGHDAVLCRQVAPPASNGGEWLLIHLDKVSGLQMLPKVFDIPDNRTPPLDAFGSIDAAQRPHVDSSLVGHRIQSGNGV